MADKNAAQATATPRSLTIELDHQTVEATVSLNVTRLNEVLRLVVDQSNAHESAIDELRQQMAAMQSKNDALSAEVARLKPDGDKMTWLTTSVDRLTAGMDKLRLDQEHKTEEVSNRLEKRVNALDSGLREEQEQRSNQALLLDEKANAARDAAKDAKDRLDRLVVPDVRPLISELKSEKDKVEAMRADVDAVKRFVAMWSFDEAAGKKALDATFTKTPAEAAAAKVAAVHATPPMQKLLEQLTSALGEVEQRANDRHMETAAALGHKADKSLVNDVAGQLATEMRKVQDNGDFLGRRMDALDGLPKRVDGLDSAVAALRTRKADAHQLDLKADESALQGVATHVTGLRDDVNDLYDRVARGGGGKAGTSGNAAGRRPSSATTQLAMQNVALTDEMKKRIAALEGDVEVLDKGKADREDLLRMHEYLDHLQHSLNRGGAKSQGTTAVPTLPTDGTQYVSHHTGQQDKDGVEYIRPSGSAKGPRPPSGRAERVDSARGRRSAGGGVDAAAALPRLHSPGNSRPASGKQRDGTPSGDGTPVQPPVFLPMVTPMAIDESPRKSSPNRAWNIGRSVGVRGADGGSTPAAISHCHSVPVVLESP